jgi:hypothetical protein
MSIPREVKRIRFHVPPPDNSGIGDSFAPPQWEGHSKKNESNGTLRPALGLAFLVPLRKEKNRRIAPAAAGNGTDYDKRKESKHEQQKTRKQEGR